MTEANVVARGVGRSMFPAGKRWCGTCAGDRERVEGRARIDLCNRCYRALSGPRKPKWKGSKR